MLRVGITGGIGSGKTTVAAIFATLGIPVLYADDVAKMLMEEDEGLRHQIVQTFGEESYRDGRLNRSFLAEKVFGDEEQLKRLNALVHPVTIAYSNKWMEAQTTPYVLKEAALFFESNSYKDLDFIIGVYASESQRIERVMKRNNITEAEVRARMSKQMNEEEKMALCDAVINNDEQHSLIEQVMELHHRLIKLSEESK